MHPVATSSLYANTDRFLGGRLGQWLTAKRESGLSHAAIAADLFAEHGIRVSPPTIGAWLNTAAGEVAA